MKKFIWLKGNIFYKARVLFALFLLVAAKVLNTSVPFIFKEVVDDLNAITGSWTGSELNLSDPNHTIGIGTNSCFFKTSLHTFPRTYFQQFMM